MAIEDILARDIRHESDFQLTASGDLATIEGKDNLVEWIRRCIITFPGSIIHRPDFGVGITAYQNKPNSLSNRTRLMSRISEQLPKDPRIVSVDAVSVSTSADSPGRITVKVMVTAQGIGRFETPELIFD